MRRVGVVRISCFVALVLAAVAEPALAGRQWYPYLFVPESINVDGKKLYIVVPAGAQPTDLAAGCTKKESVAVELTSPMAETVRALATAALLSGKKLSVGVDDSPGSCLGPNPRITAVKLVQ